jgi:hypothetical protein
MLPDNDIANARKFGIAARISSRIDPFPSVSGECEASIRVGGRSGFGGHSLVDLPEQLDEPLESVSATLP